MRKVALDASRCTACRSCEVQCSVSHSQSKELIAALFETPPSLSRVKVAWTPGLNVPVRCVHCEDAPCILSCPVGAIDRDGPTGSVLLRQEKCIGCFTCVLVCPFGAVRLSFDRKKAHKCDGCVERQQRAEDPACVCACPTGALTFVDLDGIVDAKTAEAARRETAAAAAAGSAARAGSPLETILRMREEMSRG